MKNFIIVNHKLFSQKFDYFLYPGVMVNLILAPKPLIKFLRYAHKMNANSLSGDIDKLFRLDAEYPDKLPKHQAIK